jgi:hypothetical protein
MLFEPALSGREAQRLCWMRPSDHRRSQNCQGLLQTLILWKEPAALVREFSRQGCHV